MARVLIIDDDTAFATSTGRILRSAGYDVDTAPDAVLAVKQAREGAPDLVLLDINLPGGGGVVVLERLRSLMATALTPVIIVTGGVPLSEVQPIVDSGTADAALSKPVVAQELLAAVANALGGGLG